MLRKNHSGFTLFELSIVLVIIGLIVGGVLVGQDLINAAAIKSQITQIQQYQSAVGTFQEKFGALPGDLTQQVATQFGFAARGTGAGQGDGNGILEGGAAGGGLFMGCGETVMFWVDLSNPVAGNLIGGNFTSASSTTAPGPGGNGVSGTFINLYLPPAKIGASSYVYVWSGGYSQNPLNLGGTGEPDGLNYFGLLPINKFSCTGGCSCSTPMGMQTTSSLTVKQAYEIDQKTDDGLPQSGSVMAMYAGNCQGNTHVSWADGNGCAGGFSVLPGTAATASSTTCYDNGGNAALPMNYSMSYNNGTGSNCTLSFRFQ